MRDWTALHRKCFNVRDGAGQSPCRQRQLPSRRVQDDVDGVSSRETSGARGSAASDRQLTARKRELVTLMLAALTRRDGCVTVHAERALSRGASHDEVAGAIELASAFRKGAAFVHAARAFDVDLARAAASRP